MQNNPMTPEGKSSPFEAQSSSFLPEKTTISPETRLINEVDSIAADNSRARDAIQMAVSDGTLGSSEAGDLDRQRKGCLTQLFKGFARILPSGMKNTLYEGLEMRGMEGTYIASLDSKTQQQELRYLLKRTADRVRYAKYDSIGPNLQSDLVRLSDEVVFIARELGDGDDVLHEIQRTIEALIPYHSQKGIDSTQLKICARRLVDTAVRFNPKAIGYNDVLSAYLNYYPEDARGLVDHIDSEVRSEFVSSLFDQLAYSERLSLNIESVVEFASGFEGEAAMGVFEKIAVNIDYQGRESEGGQLELAKRALATKALTGASRNLLIDMLTTGWRNVIGRTGEQGRIERIIQLTPIQEDQDRIFWNNVDLYSTDSYPKSDNPGNLDLEKVVGRATPDSQKTQIVKTLLQRGDLSIYSAREYGNNAIQQCMQTEPPDLAAIVSFASAFDVDVSSHRNLLEPYIREQFQAGIRTNTLSSLSRALEMGELVSQWEDIELDVGTHPEYGRQTWKIEQSIVDIMQNHLDAEDMRSAVRMLRAIMGDQEAEKRLQSGYGTYDMNQLWRLNKRYPYTIRGDEQDKPRIENYGKSEDEIAEVVQNIPQALPQILYLVEDGERTDIKSRKDSRRWVSEEELLELSERSTSLIGIRFTDGGFGYDDQLNAMYSSTKGGYEFQRGTFGEGAKMSMISLAREGCEVSMASTYLNGVSGLRYEWDLSPDIREDNVYLKGRKRAILGIASDDLPTGSRTEIIFEKANPTVRRQLERMLDSRSGPGIQFHILDYDPNATRLYGSLESDAQIIGGSHDQRKQGELYVQGLHVNHPSEYQSPFIYNFPNSGIFTGRDRAFLDKKTVDRELKGLWIGLTDETAVDTFIDKIVLDGVLSKGRIEHRILSWLGSSYGLKEDAKEIHSKILRAKLGLSSDKKKVVVVTASELAENPQIKDRLVSEGYAVYSGRGAHELIDDYTIKGYVNYLLGDAVVSFDQLERSLRRAKEEEMVVGEELHGEFDQIFDSARKDIEELLRDESLAEYRTGFEKRKIN